MTIDGLFSRREDLLALSAVRQFKPNRFPVLVHVALHMLSGCLELIR